MAHQLGLHGVADGGDDQIQRPDANADLEVAHQQGNGAPGHQDAAHAQNGHQVEEGDAEGQAQLVGDIQQGEADPQLCHGQEEDDGVGFDVDHHGILAVAHHLQDLVPVGGGDQPPEEAEDGLIVCGDVEGGHDGDDDGDQRTGDAQHAVGQGLDGGAGKLGGVLGDGGGHGLTGLVDDLGQVHVDGLQDLLDPVADLPDDRVEVLVHKVGDGAGEGADLRNDLGGEEDHAADDDAVEGDAQHDGGTGGGFLSLQMQAVQGELDDGGDDEADDEGHQNRQQILPEQQHQSQHDGIEDGVDDEILFGFHRWSFLFSGTIGLVSFSHFPLQWSTLIFGFCQILIFLCH